MRRLVDRLARVAGLVSADALRRTGGHQDMRAGVYLGRDRLLVQANWGGYMVVPTFNVDVAIGIIRDGVIEPWTTRLIQELVRPGQKVLNAGANFGYYAVLCGHLVQQSGKVFAVDANPHIIPYLNLSRYWAGLPDRIEVYHAALWNKSGEKVAFQFDPQFLGGGSAVAGVGHSVTDFEAAIWSAETTRTLTMPNRKVVMENGVFVGFEATTITIDDLVGNAELDLIQLDIEGAEPYAMLGAVKVVERSPNLRITMEWMGSRVSKDDELSRAAGEVYDMLDAQGFRVRQLRPMVHADGGISLSEPLSRQHMLSEAPHGDYVWLRPKDDPWGW